MIIRIDELLKLLLLFALLGVIYIHITAIIYNNSIKIENSDNISIFKINKEINKRIKKMNRR